MGMFRRLINIGVGLVATVSAILLLKNHQKNSLYEAEFRVIEPEEDTEPEQK